MKNEDIIKTALDAGFFSAAVIGTEKLVFDYSFRKYCEENLCGNYGVSYSCPPFCGTPEELHARIASFPYVAVFQSKWPEIREFNANTVPLILDAKAKHNASQQSTVAAMKKAGHEGVFVGASGCALCGECAARENKPCPHPEEVFFCLSAYCINVSKLAESCSMDFSPADGSLTLYGLYAFR